MDTVTLTSKFEVAIPRKIREQLKLQPGQKFQAIACNNRIALIPMRPIKDMKGFLKGIATNVPREGDRI